MRKLMAELKHDMGKPRFELVPPSAIRGMAEALTYGAEMHYPFSWQKVESVRFLGALMRHLDAYRMGEEIDKESGIPHLVLMMTNAAFLLEKGYVPTEWRTTYECTDQTK